jgi:hypothetical protein
MNVDTLPRKRETDFKRIYCNNTAFGLSQFDVSMTFGEIVPDPTGPPTIHDHAVVTMSWEHFATLHDAMGKIIAGFEAQQKTKIRKASDSPPLAAM